MSTPEIKVKKAEGKIVKFTYVDEDGDAVDMTGASFVFVAKSSKSDSSYVIAKDDSSFNKTYIASGIVRLALTSSDLNITAGVYVAEIRAAFTSSNTDKSTDIELLIEESVIH